LSLGSADVRARSSNNRISWHLDQPPYGGWRSGSNVWLNSNPQWRKVVMYGPCKVR
jgi:hypothetical protein